MFFIKLSGEYQLNLKYHYLCQPCFLQSKNVLIEFKLAVVNWAYSIRFTVTSAIRISHLIGQFQVILFNSGRARHACRINHWSVPITNGRHEPHH